MGADPTACKFTRIFVGAGAMIALAPAAAGAAATVESPVVSVAVFSLLSVGASAVIDLLAAPLLGFRVGDNPLDEAGLEESSAGGTATELP